MCARYNVIPYPVTNLTYLVINFFGKISIKCVKPTPKDKNIFKCNIVLIIDWNVGL